MLNKTVKFEDLITFTRNSAATYWDANGVLQTAAIDEPRFDHDPVTGEPLGIPIEEARTNFLPTSDESGFGAFDSAPTTDEQVSSSATPVSALQGFVRHVVGGTALHLSSQAFNNPATTGPHVVSLIVKPVVGGAGFRLGGNIVETAGNVLVNAAGDVTVNTPSVIESGAVPLKDGWFILWASFNLLAGAEGEVGILYFAIGDPGSGSSEGYFAAASYETGSSFTSYIPTTGAAATRANELADVNDMSPWFTQGQGTLFVDFYSASSYVPGNIQFAATINDVSSSEYNALLRLTNAGASATTRKNGASQYTHAFDHPLLTGNVTRFGFSFSDGYFAYSVNGLPANVQESGSTNKAQDVLSIGGGFASYANGHIRSLRYYPYTMPAGELEDRTA